MFKPFQQGTESHSIHDLTVENAPDHINIYGNLQLSKDRQGLAAARTLQALLNQVVSTLESEQDLPEKLQARATQEVENPFL